MFKKDWIMDQISSLIMVITNVFLKKDNPEYIVSVDSSSPDTDALYWKLDTLLKEHKINEAENILFDEIQISNPKYLEVAVDFYHKVNNLSDDVLEQSNFTHSEVEEGLKDIMDMFGIVIV